ncbi:MAG: HU family DNA-binding protein [Candidatus Cloacimonetes bacterium]|nr:HU family DNA-binding protein [Candidatus Cloacimonadota bacterium]
MAIKTKSATRARYLCFSIKSSMFHSVYTLAGAAILSTEKKAVGPIRKVFCVEECTIDNMMHIAAMQQYRYTQCPLRRDIKLKKDRKIVFFWLTEYLSTHFNNTRISLAPIKTTLGGKMSRDELVKKIASDAGVSQKVAGLALASVLEGITQTLKGGGKVSLVGFGSFSVAARKARKGINPKTKAPLKIPARKSSRFQSRQKNSKTLSRNKLIIFFDILMGRASALPFILCFFL